MATDYYNQNRKRNQRVKVHLDDFQLQRLNMLTAATGKSREQVLRELVMDLKILKDPPFPIEELQRHFISVGDKVNRVTVTLRVHDFFDDVTYNEAMNEYKIIKKLMNKAFKAEQEYFTFTKKESVNE